MVQSPKNFDTNTTEKLSKSFENTSESGQEINFSGLYSLCGRTINMNLIRREQRT